MLQQKSCSISSRTLATKAVSTPVARHLSMPIDESKAAPTSEVFSLLVWARTWGTSCCPSGDSMCHKQNMQLSSAYL